MADIVSQIPYPLSGGLTPATSIGAYQLQDNLYDYALSGVPFLSATRDAWPHKEGMVPIRKQQFDAQQEPGEQSLTDWWFRSQSSFTGGAGVLYQDPDTDNQFGFRYADSLGINPWTSGELSLLRDTQQIHSLGAGPNYLRGYINTLGFDRAWFTYGTGLHSTNGITDTPITGGASPILGLGSSGARYLLLRADGIWSNINTNAEVLMYSPPAGSPTTGVIAFAKERIVAAWDNAIYFAPIVTTGLPAALPSVSYTHSDPLWRWTSVTEGPAAIYAAGTNGTTSSIFKFVLDLSSGTPSLTPSVAAVTPTGEIINTIYGYVGTFMGIASNQGFRVAELTGDGDIAYGPLLFTPTGGCKGIVGYDRYMWTGTAETHEGASGLYRIDLGSAVQEQTSRAIRYAYARDLIATDDSAPVVALDVFGTTNRMVFLTSESNLWLEHESRLVPEGWLQTGRIRFNTEEPKLFKFVSLRAPQPLQGDLLVSLLDQNGGEHPYLTYGTGLAPGGKDIATPTPSGPQVWIALKFTLRRNADDNTIGGKLNGWQVKALPATARQRFITTTFLLFDEEMDKSGQRIGHEGYARERYELFKAMARAGDVISFQELVDNLTTLVTVEDWEFTQASPPGAGGNTFGGFLTVKLRTVAETT